MVLDLKSFDNAIIQLEAGLYLLEQLKQKTSCHD